MRFAVYASPAADDPMLAIMEQWLGRSAFGHDVSPDPGPFSQPDHESLAKSRARYGFHATMVAPFLLAENATKFDLKSNLSTFGRTAAPVDVGPLKIATFGRYLALVPVEQPQALTDLAQALVEHTQSLRAPLTQAEFDRRNTPDLSPRRRELLKRWGYAATEEEFKFHLTLAGPVDPPLLDQGRDYLQDLLAPFLAKPFLIDAVYLFCEPEPPGPFHIADQWQLAG
ncbi:MAG: DUF1045 domain-containing protein [Pseudomonadota bacterium]